MLRPFFYAQMSENKIVKIGTELIKGMGNAFKSLSGNNYDRTFDIIPDSYTRSGFYFFGDDGRDYPFTHSGISSSLKAYECCPPVTSIINKKAAAYTNGKIWVLNSQKKEAKGATADRLRKLLTQPNPLQTWNQFDAQNYVYQQLFGYNIVLSIKPVGFSENIDASSLWNIPPFMIEIELTKRLFYQTDMKGIIKSVKLNYEGAIVPIPVEDITIMRDMVPNFNSPVFPESRLKSQQWPINNIIGSLESRGELINYRGARGIFTNGGKDMIGNAPPITEPEKKDIEDQFRKYGMRRGQRQFIFTSAALNWQAIGQPVKDMMLFEECQESTMSLCDSYGYPYRLLSAEKSASYNDVKEFKKMLYEDTIIPESLASYEQWNNFFDTEAYNLHIERDYAHVNVLQEDKLKQAQTRYTLNRAVVSDYQNDIITLNRMRELMDEDTTPDGDKYYSEVKKNNTNGTETQTGQAQGG